MFTFDGTTSVEFAEDNSCDLIVTDVRRGLTSDFSHALAEVAGRPGAYILGTRVAPRTIEVDVTLAAADYEDARTAEQALVEWLVTDDARDLSFSDEPTRYFRARFAGSTGFGEGTENRFGTLVFLAADPYLYATEEVHDLSVGDTTVSNGGGVDTYPIISVPVLGPTTYVEAASGTKKMLVGRPENVDDAATVTKRTELSDDCSSTSGWSTGTTAIDGAVAGTMVSNGDVFSPLLSGGSIGTGSGWHGPTIRKGLANISSIFTAECGVKLDNTSSPYVSRTNEVAEMHGTTPNKLGYKSVDDSQVTDIKVTNTAGTVTYSTSDDYTISLSGGYTYITRKSGSDITDGQTVHVDYKYLVGKVSRIEMYLLDENGALVGRVGVSDPFKERANTHLYAMVKNTAGTWKTIVDTYGAKAGEYNDFRGVMRLSCKNATLGKWSAYFAERNDAGKLHNSKSGSIVGFTTNPVAMVELHIAGKGVYQMCPTAYVGSVSVVSKSVPDADGPAFVADVGDIVEIDCSSGAVRITGEPRMDLLSIESEVFSLPVGDSTVTLRTDGPVSDATVSFSERWL